MRIEGILRKKLKRHNGVSVKTGAPYDIQNVIVDAIESFTKRDGSVVEIQQSFVISCNVKDGVFGYEEGQKMCFEVYFVADEFKGNFYQKCTSRFYYALN